jgi:hypothetical protein
MKQNQCAESLEHYTLRGCQKIDEPLKTINGDNTTLRHLLLFSRDTSGEYLFETVERANENRIFLIYNKTTTPEKRREVRKFVKHLRSEIHTVLTSESIQKITEKVYNMSFYQNDTQQHSRLTDAVKKYEDFITSNPQEEEVITEHFPSTPTNLRKKYFFTDQKTLDTNTNMTASYSQVASTTSLSATQISVITESVASKKLSGNNRRYNKNYPINPSDTKSSGLL